jgi:hypothetical protein
MSIAEKLTTIAENQQKVYEAGKDAMVLKITDIVTDNNARKNYNSAFQNGNWDSFKFAYPIKVTGAVAQMFYNSQLTKLPTPIDWSELATITTYDTYAYRRGVFGYCGKLKEIDLSPTGLNMRAISGIEEWFQFCRNLETIKGLNVNENTIYNNTFILCEKLVNLSFAAGSVIGQSIDIHWSTLLSADSIENIFNCLSTTSTGQVLTLPTTAEATYNAKFGANAYATKVSSKSNWQIKTA